MKYYLITYVGEGEHGYREDTEQRQEFEVALDAVKALCDKVGDENLFRALEWNFGDMIHWVKDTLGYAVGTDFEIDPVD